MYLLVSPLAKTGASKARTGVLDEVFTSKFTITEILDAYSKKLIEAYTNDKK